MCIELGIIDGVSEWRVCVEQQKMMHRKMNEISVFFPFNLMIITKIAMWTENEHRDILCLIFLRRKMQHFMKKKDYVYPIFTTKRQWSEDKFVSVHLELRDLLERLCQFCSLLFRFFFLFLFVVYLPSRTNGFQLSHTQFFWFAKFLVLL